MAAMWLRKVKNVNNIPLLWPGVLCKRDANEIKCRDTEKKKQAWTKVECKIMAVLPIKNEHDGSFFQIPLAEIFIIWCVPIDPVPFAIGRPAIQWHLTKNGQMAYKW